jgi:hypothetical protein
VEYATQSGQAVAGSDFTPNTGVLTWADGDTANKTITVNILNDNNSENMESFSILLSNAQGASIGIPASTMINISDDDVATSNGGGGGGRFDLLTLLALLLVHISMRRRELPGQFT